MAIDTTLSEDDGGTAAGYATPYWEYAAVTEIKPNGTKEVVFLSRVRMFFDLSQPVSTVTNTDIGKLKSVRSLQEVITRQPTMTSWRILSTTAIGFPSQSS
ncbi:hypothetical protein [Butyrivibrio sp. FCS014]|uniref:hypothetical protein n=1 Tax=Butyrivibrio sp. FCS014 TaxID=1408304 RepID=UPI000467CC6D|nr:hypothetical protein [Butyrivibrio sp. FCS014]